MLPADHVDSILLPPGDGMSQRVASRLHIWPVQDSDAGRYQCVASNELGSSYSSYAIVSVNGKPGHHHLLFVWLIYRVLKKKVPLYF